MINTDTQLRKTHFHNGGTPGLIGHAHVWANVWRTSPAAHKRTTLTRTCECGAVQRWTEYAQNVKARQKRRY